MRCLGIIKYFQCHFLHDRKQCIQRMHFKRNKGRAAQTNRAHVSKVYCEAGCARCVVSACQDLRCGVISDAADIQESSAPSRINRLRVVSSHSQ